MPSQKKIELLDRYTDTLNEKPNFILTRYTGLNVEQITDLRRKLYEKGFRYTVLKNNIFNLAISKREDLAEYPSEKIEGAIAGVFSDEDLPGAAKILKDYSKNNDKLQIMSGVFESKYLSDKEVEGIAGLPSKEELLAQIASSINAPASQLASMMNTIMASLARGIKAVGEKNG